MSKIQFDPTISVGTILTITGGMLTLIVSGVTAYVQLGDVREQQKAMADKLVLIGDRISANTASMSRIEGRIDVLMERRRAELDGLSPASAAVR